MTLHLMRLPVDRRALAAFAVASGISDDDAGYALHLALRQRFGTAGPQPFRFLAEGRGDPHLLGYAHDPLALQEAAGLPATDERLDQIFTAPPQLRAMPTVWREGARYGFEVRVRPVVRFSRRLRDARSQTVSPKDSYSWWARAGEVDAWVAARTRPGGDPDTSRETAYHDWLAARLAEAASLDEVALTLFQRVRTRRSSHGRPGNRSVQGPDAVMAGTLTVRDPAAFAQALARGIGRHVAFGYGMLLLSPPRTAG